MSVETLSIPPLFVSHGAPNMILHESATRSFLDRLGDELPRPKAVITVSAHFMASRPAVVADPKPEMIYDFGGFERELYTMKYPAPGDPALAERALGLLDAAGLDPARIEKRGFDHGSWAPMKLMYPAADLPVVQLSVQPRRDPRHHYEVGRALAPLAKEGVLILASGSLTHNLHEAFDRFGGMKPLDAPEPEWVSAFADWFVEKTAEGDVEALLDYRERAPFAGRNHPTDEHLLPFFVALGAGGAGVPIHRETQFAVLALDAYRFAG
ncbi:MAG: dioxygenase [Hyphomicrobiales bacterium]|nr:dioxygenase [Hyphomicrobiales bacterium]